MIDFSLDILQKFAEAIANYELSSNKAKDLLAFIIFYNSIRVVELKAEELLIGFEKYTDLSDRNFDLSILRSLVRDFSFVIYKFVDYFRKYSFRSFGTPLEIFKPELVETLVTVGTIKSIFCRSLLEIAIK
jgi:hypothetical protein